MKKIFTLVMILSLLFGTTVYAKPETSQDYTWLNNANAYTYSMGGEANPL